MKRMTIDHHWFLDRWAVELLICEMLSVREVAERLGVNGDYVRSAVFRVCGRSLTSARMLHFREVAL